MAAGGGALVLAGVGAPRGWGAPRGRVHVVGAGLAGLACAARLTAAGVDVRVWDARDRLGGRVLTDLSLVPGGWVECGGEFIDADHSAMRSLCRSYGIALQDLADLDAPGEARDLIAGRVRVDGWAARQDALLSQRAARDLRAMGAARLDRMAASAWLARAIPGWPASPFARYRAALVSGEFGVDPSGLSALWVVADLAEGAGADEMQDDTERYRIEGGTIRLVRALQRSIGAGRITLSTRITAIARGAKGVTLAMQGPGGPRTERGDAVVITLPPPLVGRVDMRRSGVPRSVLAGIAAIGMGTNAKLIIPFSRPAWQRAGWNADGTSDTVLGSTWAATMGQDAGGAALTTLVGGRRGVVIAGPDHGPAPDAAVRERLALVDRIARGASASALRGSVVHAWARDPFARGSYSAARPGRAESWPDLARPYGPLHFAGEHSDDEFSGYMEGAVRSGQRAARQVIDSL